MNLQLAESSKVVEGFSLSTRNNGMYDEGGVVMHFHEQKCIDEQSLLELYGSVGWTAYTTDSKQLMKAVEQSLKVITVW